MAAIRQEGLKVRGIPALQEPFTSEDSKQGPHLRVRLSTRAFRVRPDEAVWPLLDPSRPLVPSSQRSSASPRDVPRSLAPPGRLLVSILLCACLEPPRLLHPSGRSERYAG